MRFRRNPNSHQDLSEGKEGSQAQLRPKTLREKYLILQLQPSSLSGKEVHVAGKRHFPPQNTKRDSYRRKIPWERNSQSRFGGGWVRSPLKDRRGNKQNFKLLE